MFDGRRYVRTGKYLYTDDVGRDACGVGGVAAGDGKPSHEVVAKTLLGLRNLEHRGGVCGQTGDGAGILCQIPQAFFRAEARRLNLRGARDLAPNQALAVGMVFLPADESARDAARRKVADALAGGPVTPLGWRVVPTNPDAVPDAARRVMPAIEQLLLRVDGNADVAESWLYAARLALRHRLAAANLGAYVVSLSMRLVGYKGLLTGPQFADFFPDLADESFAAAVALFHRRYSTNTYPDWTLAQPFRYLCHNGEINTIRANRNAVNAYAHGLEPPLPGRALLTPRMSDSASLDEWVEHLTLAKGWSLLRALRLTVPPVWDNEADYWGQEAFDLFAHARRTYGSLCAWDGPAGIVASDGRVLAGLVDRMGLRPVRWCSDDRGWLYVGSESGVFGLDSARIAASGQLQPGQMIAFDTATGTRLDSHQILDRIAVEARAELGDLHELNRTQIVIPEAFNYSPRFQGIVDETLTTHHWKVDHWMQAHGWDFERAVFVKDMAKLRKEPLSSMGFDRVLTVFSAHHPTLFKYLQQTFAEVTNPPIDPYREGGAMSLTTYLGRPAAGPTGSEGPTRQIELSSPVLSDEAFDDIRTNELLKPCALSATFPLAGGRAALRDALNRLQGEAEQTVREGYGVLLVTHVDVFNGDLVPIPSLLATAAVHQHLCRRGLRGRCSLVVQAGDVQEAHDICCLVGFGADAVHPYLVMRLVRDGLTFKDADTQQPWDLSPRESLENVVVALEDGVRKIIAKMGITTIEGYRGAMLFEAVGVGPELAEYLGDVPARIGGIGLQDLVDDAAWRLQRAEQLVVLGRNRDYHAYNGKVRTALRKAATAGDNGVHDEDGAEAAYERKLAANRQYAAFSELVTSRTPTVLRDLFQFADAAAIPLDEVEPAQNLACRYFRGSAMSHGALTGVAHQTIAAAFNDLGGQSNSGEGGESRFRNDAPERPWGPFWGRVLGDRRKDPAHWCLGGDMATSRFRSRIRQVASGRFGVDAEYLINADELQIKMAQGAKPGEGGQLMGKKVTSEIAEIRFAKPGTDLISPPPHHDIYSIEDLAQLIHDLKAIKPGVLVSVKLVAVENIGTIAVGVAKAGADIIEIDGIDGGTGAAMASSKEHCGLPSEMGLAEVHQALVLNGLRTSVRLRVGGGIKTGVDVVKFALFGADEFSFGQALMVSVGCIVCKSCHIPNCPTGITGTQGEYKGKVAHTKAYLLAVADEVRGVLAKLGARTLAEITGRSDLLARRGDLTGRAALVDVSRFLHPDMALCRLDETFPQRPSPGGVCSTSSGESPSANARLAEDARDAVENAVACELNYPIRNGDRSVGATLAGQIARTYGREGLPDGATIRARFTGEAGQSFGAWCVHGLDLTLFGWAQDGVAKGISGGAVVVMLDPADRHVGGEIQSVAGNNVAYGATGGRVYVGGRSGHRLAIRNSGATIVAEAAGKYACEYMTRGRVVILGPVENEIGSGMTGGELVVYDRRNEAPGRLHGRSVTAVDCTYIDYEWLHPLVIDFFYRTRSRQAEWILDNWGEVRRARWFRKVLPLAVARKAEDYIAAGSNAG